MRGRRDLSGLPWAEIRRDWLRVRSVDVLADQHGISVNTLFARAAREGWGRRGHGGGRPMVNAVRFGELWRAGVSTTAIALEMGIRPESVPRTARRLGLPARPAPTHRREPLLPRIRKHERTRPKLEHEPRLWRCTNLECQQLTTVGPRCPGCQDRDTQGAA